MESVALLFSSGRHTPATAPAHPDAKAQPCVDCAVPLGELSALFSLASASRASLLLVRGGLLARGRISSPLSAAAMLPPVLP